MEFEKEFRKTKGFFIKENNGYYSFRLDNDDIIVFEQIERGILKNYNLKTDRYIGMYFDIVYSESYDEFESDDFIVFRLENLELISE